MATLHIARPKAEPWLPPLLLALMLALPRLAGAAAADDSCGHAPNKQICLPEAYSKFELPFTDTVNVVEIGIEILDVLRINDKEYSVTFSSYFNVLWKEPRLRITDSFFKELNYTADASMDTLIPVNLELVNELWLPNIFIYNLKTFKVVEVLSKHAGLWVTANNEILYSQATHITFICPMRFDSFPLDTQSCKFQVGSYSYDDSKMIFVESPRVKGYEETSRSIVLDYDVHIAQLGEADRTLIYGTLGNYSLAGFEMILHRYVSHYIITYYLPSGLFVVVSWISFVVPPDVIPGRMALLITLFLVLVNIFNSVTTNTPKAEGLTAIEAWMLACILFVFGALVEYAAILFRKQTAKDDGDMLHRARMRQHSLYISNHGQAPPTTTVTATATATATAATAAATTAATTTTSVTPRRVQQQQQQLQQQQQTQQQPQLQLQHLRDTFQPHYGTPMHAYPSSAPPFVNVVRQQQQQHFQNTLKQQQLQAQPPQQKVQILFKENHKYEMTSVDNPSSLGPAAMTAQPQKKQPPPPPPRGNPIGSGGQNVANSIRTNAAYMPPQQQQQQQQQLSDFGIHATQQQQPEAFAESALDDDLAHHEHDPCAEIFDDSLCQSNSKGTGSIFGTRGLRRRDRRGDLCGEDYLHVDRFFLVAMPMLFLAFNVVYWTSYGRHFLFATQGEPPERY